MLAAVAQRIGSAGEITRVDVQKKSGRAASGRPTLGDDGGSDRNTERESSISRESALWYDTGVQMRV